MKALCRVDLFDSAYESDLSSNLFQGVETFERVLNRLDKNGPRDLVEDAGDPLLGRQKDGGIPWDAHRSIIPVKLRRSRPQVPLKTQRPGQEAGVDAQAVG